MAKPLRIGFIGVSGIANQHMASLKSIEGVELAAAADIKEEALQKVQEAHGVQEVYTDYKKMFKEANLDAISVCTPNFLHKQPTIDALKAGHHVIVEKPMAMNAKECEAMNKAAAASGKHLVVGFQWRFTPQAQFLRRQVQEGVFGDINYVRVQALRRRGIPSWGVFGNKELQGGGGLIDIGVHLLEMAHFIIGGPDPESTVGSTYQYLGNKKPETKTLWGDWDYKSYTVEDLATGYVKFKNGTSLVIESSFATHIKEETNNVQIMGSKGGGNFNPLEIYTDANGYMMDSTPNFIGEDEHWKEKMEHFVGVCRGERENISTGHDGWAVQEILDGIYSSAEKGKEIRFK